MSYILDFQILVNQSRINIFKFGRIQRIGEVPHPLDTPFNFFKFDSDFYSGSPGNQGIFEIFSFFSSETSC